MLVVNYAYFPHSKLKVLQMTVCLDTVHVLHTLFGIFVINQSINKLDSNM